MKSIDKIEYKERGDVILVSIKKEVESVIIL